MMLRDLEHFLIIIGILSYIYLLGNFDTRELECTNKILLHKKNHYLLNINQ